jgi:chemotaxis response regulator CheB
MTPSHRPEYIVGIGASAGGLEALERFFDNVPRDTGMAFVLVQHLSPDFKSLMDELLARHTELPIRLVEDGMTVEADHVYLIPPKKEMIVSGGRLLRASAIGSRSCPCRSTSSSARSRRTAGRTRSPSSCPAAGATGRGASATCTRRAAW